jgi:hypothetical protein
VQERLGPSQWRGAALATLGIIGICRYLWGNLIDKVAAVCMQERLGPSQWRGAALATLGIIGMGISSSGSSSSSSSSEAHVPAAAAADQQPGPGIPLTPPLAAAAAADVPSPGRVLCCFLLLLGLLGCEVVWRQRKEAAAAARRRRGGGAAGVVGSAEAAAAADAAACGLEAGCCFGFSAAAARTGNHTNRLLLFVYCAGCFLCMLQRLGWGLMLLICVQVAAFLGSLRANNPFTVW